MYTPDRQLDPDDEIETEICCICLHEIFPYDTNIVDDLGKDIIVCNYCKNKFNLKEK